MSEEIFASSLAWLVNPPFLPSLGRRLLFVVLLTNVLLDLTKMKLNAGKCKTVK